MALATQEGFKQNLFYFRHFTLLTRLPATHSTFANFIFQHRIVAGAAASKFVAGYDVPEVDKAKGDEKYAEDQSEDVQEFHRWLIIIV